MKRILIALCLFLSVIMPRVARAADWSETVAKVKPSVVWAQVGEDGGCTAFVVNVEKHYLLTAAHCKPASGQTLWVDSVPASVIFLDPKRDLMIVEAKDLDPSRPALKLASKNPVIGQDVMSIGYGYAQERPMYRQAHIQDDKMVIQGLEGGPFVSTDSAFIPGQSGGPVVDIDGLIVSIVQRGDGGTTGLGVGVETIRERVGRFFSAKK